MTEVIDQEVSTGSELVVAPAVDGDLEVRKEYARTLATSNMLPRHLQNKPADVLYAMELADSLGIHRILAFKEVHVIEGKPEASAELVRALIRRAGHKLRITYGEKEVSIVGARRDDPAHWETYTFRWEEAVRAGLATRDTWKKWPQDMMLARCTSRIRKAMFSDVATGLGVLHGEDDVTFAEPASAAEPQTLTEKVRAKRTQPERVEQVDKATGELPIDDAVIVEDPPGDFDPETGELIPPGAVS
jgi:hypothetical protein